ncbi:hypothetical protein [Castellaniella defragrans]|uniref:hypothetical protein n=1 Tax=Castellaniella defragrans TaxID=75697 RepID=UPI002AFE2427|nr:hypothetical protein [Castellaniella defragrans]
MKKLGFLDDIPANPSCWDSLAQLQARFNRRRFLIGSLGAGAVSFLGRHAACSAQAPAASGLRHRRAGAGFRARGPMQTADAVVVPPGMPMP